MNGNWKLNKYLKVWVKYIIVKNSRLTVDSWPESQEQLKTWLYFWQRWQSHDDFERCGVLWARILSAITNKIHYTKEK